MISLVETYRTFSYPLIHPFKANALKEELHEDVLLNEESSEKSFFSLYESIALAWPFVLGNAFLRLFMIYIALLFVETWTAQNPEGYFSYSHLLTYWKYHFVILSLVSGVILFPLLLLIKSFLWEVTIHFFLFVRGSEASLEGDQEVRDIISRCLSSHVFYVVPVLGELIQFFSYYLILYGGLRGKLNFSRLESFFILFFPLILLSLLMGFLGVTFSLIIMT